MKKAFAIFSVLVATCAADEKVVTMDAIAKEQVVAQRPIALEIASVLPNAKEVELVSLNPEAAEPQSTAGLKRFGFAMLGSAVSKEKKEIAALAASLRDGILESNGEMADCFYPRHAICFLDGDQRVDIVVCFQCAQGYVQRGANQRWFTVTQKPGAVFDAIFKAHGLKKVP